MDRPKDASTQSLHRSPKAARLKAHARLSQAHPVGSSWTVGLSTHSITLGRDQAPEIQCLPHPTVSRRHLVIEWSSEAGCHRVTDLESRNGSRLDGVPLPPQQPRPLSDGSVLRVGDVLLVYEQIPSLPEGAGPSVSLDAIPGVAAAMEQLRRAVARIAGDFSPVLLVGPTGSGKEWVAGELHRLSGRTGKFVPVNCSALSPELVESQLFGHRRGAFTGAAEAQIGLFRAADRGTLFLDEVGELPLELQAKLLRAVEEASVLPVGGTEAVPVDMRVIAATHRDLGGAVESGAFRRDLYARLSIWELKVPALNQRRIDVLPWVQRFEELWGKERRRPVQHRIFAPDAAEALLLCDWPTNLRGVNRLVHELDELAVDAGPIARDQLPAWVLTAAGGAEVPAEPSRQPVPTREQFEASFVELEGSVHALARHFGRDRRQIYRWMESFGIKRRDGN